MPMEMLTDEERACLRRLAREPDTHMPAPRPCWTGWW